MNKKRRYIGVLDHLNDLNLWGSQNRSLIRLQKSPPECPDVPEDKILLLMAIKSKPSAHRKREVLRRKSLMKDITYMM